MTNPSHALVVAMPVFEDRESASQLLSEIARVCDERPYILAIEDGSVRNPLQITDISDAGLEGEILRLVRNMGHQRAIAAGIAYIALHLDAARVVVMDSDGEDRPESIAGILSKLDTQSVDVVVARRRKRSESPKFKAFYVIYKLIFKVLTGRKIAFGNFTALSGRAVRRLAAMQELWVHFAASLMTSRLRIGEVMTDRGKRYAGKPHMNFVSLSLHGMRSIMVFAEDVLIRVGLLCTAIAAGAILLSATAVILKLVGLATPGWFSTAVGILLIIFMQAGVLTFVTLMVAGLVRNTPPLTRADLDLLIERVEKTGTRVDQSPAPRASTLAVNS